MAKEVKFLRMTTGEDIISEVDFLPNDRVKLTNPIAAIAMGMQQNGKPQIGFAPWPPFTTDRTVTIDRRHIIAETTPLQEFLNEYQSMTSKIVTPSQKLIIPT